jgi:hypothetical protein
LLSKRWFIGTTNSILRQLLLEWLWIFQFRKNHHFPLLPLFVLESGWTHGMRMNFASFTVALVLRSEFPSRKTGFTAEPKF